MLKTYLMIVLTFMSYGSLASEIEIPDLLDVGDAKAGSALVALMCSLSVELRAKASLLIGQI